MLATYLGETIPLCLSAALMSKPVRVGLPFDAALGLASWLPCKDFSLMLADVAAGAG